jgi:hypothetical protein
VADLQRVISYDDAFDQQLQDPLPVHQGRLFQSRPCAVAEGLEIRPYLLGCVLLGAKPGLLLALGR